MGIWWQSGLTVQVNCITGGHIGNYKLDTDIKETAGFYHQKDNFILLCFDRLSNLRYLLSMYQ